MEEPRNAFLADAPRRIRDLREDLQRLNATSGDSSHELLRQIFRRLHTLKGSAAAFDFPAVSRTAHELENVLENVNEQNLSASIAVLQDGIGEIEKLFAAEGENLFQTNEEKIAGWRRVYQDSTPLQTETRSGRQAENPTETALPFDLEKQLNSAEIKRLRQALERNSTLAVVLAEFAAAEFAAEFAALQAELNAAGETIAALPDAERTKNGKIALRLIFVRREEVESLTATLAHSRAGIIAVSENETARGGTSSSANRKARLLNLWAQAALAGEKTAAAQGKKVVFEVFGAEECEIAAELDEACEIALLHIARNAVAHGIETPAERRARGKNEIGAIRLECWRENDHLCLRISDDGRGIEAEKIMRRAKERGFIGEDAVYQDEDAFRIIFSSGFTTAERVTEDAGRGIGLDAVESAVRAVCGRVEVSSEPLGGTSFLIRFPNQSQKTEN